MNRNSLNTFEKRIDRLASLAHPRLKPLDEQDRIVRTSVALTLFGDMPPVHDKRARKVFFTDLLNSVRLHQSEIDGFEQDEFENRVCRSQRALSEMTFAGSLNPLLVPFESRFNYLFLDPPEWFLRGPISGSPWGAVEIDGKRYGAIFSTSYWTKEDLAVWETKQGIIKAARERVPQIQGRWLHQKYRYAEYLTSEEKAMLTKLPKSPRSEIYWPGPSGEEFLF
jgi:hypothetical protein